MAYQQQYVMNQPGMHHQQQAAQQAHPHAVHQAQQLELGGQSASTAAAVRRPFDPTAHELDANFRLTRFADLKGRGCKVPQDILLKLLEGLQDDSHGEGDHGHFMHMAIPRIGELQLFTPLYL